MKSLHKAAILIGVALLAGACAGDPDISALPREPQHRMVESDGPATPLQCVPYARLHSTVKLYGDAYTWWDQAAGKFQRTDAPQAGAVMVLTGYAGPARGHVAVVRKIINTREIRVDHANWLDDGSIYIDDPVVDVSADNDWSRVKVWNIKAGGWGAKTYPVQGFIGSDRDAAPDEAPDLVARTGGGMGAVAFAADE